MESVVNASRRRALQFLAGAPMLPLSSTLAGASLLLAGFGAGDAAVAAQAVPTAPVTLTDVSFSSMSAPTLASAAAMATTTVGSVMSVSFSDKRKLDFRLAYQPFFVTGDRVPDGKARPLRAAITTSTTSPSSMPPWPARSASTSPTRRMALRC